MKRKTEKQKAWLALQITVALTVVAVVVILNFTSTKATQEIDETKFIIPETTVVPAVDDEDMIHPDSVAAFTDDEIIAAAKTVWGEARGIDSQMEQAAVVWCFLNRVDKFHKSLGEIVTEPNQFAFDSSFPTTDDNGRDLTVLVRDVVERWSKEKAGAQDAGRVLPMDYIYFGGDGQRNYFRTDYYSFENVWQWELPNPYNT